MTNDNKSVRLRAMEPEDLDFLYEVENDSSIWDVGVTNVPYSRYLLLNYIASSSGDIYKDRQVRLMVENEEGTTIGMVDLVDFSPAHHRAELGVVLKKEFRGQGYGTAMIAQVLEYGRKVVHLHQIYAIVQKENEKCQMLLKNTGFQKVNELKEWLYDGTEYHSADFFSFFL